MNETVMKKVYEKNPMKVKKKGENRRRPRLYRRRRIENERKVRKIKIRKLQQLAVIRVIVTVTMYL